jgi:hypothetical protein
MLPFQCNGKWQLALSIQHSAFSPRISLVLFQPASFPARLGLIFHDAKRWMANG